MRGLPPRSTRSATLRTYTPLCRCGGAQLAQIDAELRVEGAHAVQRAVDVDGVVMSSCAQFADEALRLAKGIGATPHQRTRSEEHTSELQSLLRISYAVFCFKKNNRHTEQLQPCTSANRTETE